MSLREKASMIIVYLKNAKKSIRFEDRIDIFLILALLVLIISPLVINLFLKVNAEPRHISLFLSPRCEELLGKETTEMLLREFMEQNPDLRIRLANFMDEKGPDIFVFDDGEFSALAAVNALVELNSYTGYETDARQLAIPLVSFMDMLFYNIDILTAAGFDRPPKTRDEFTAYARTVSRTDFSGVSAAALSLSPDDPRALSRDIFSWIWAAGGNFWPGEEYIPALNARAVTSDLAFLGGLSRDGALAPGIFETAGEQRVEEFSRGRIAMMVASAGAIPFLREKMGDAAFGITTVPSPGTGGRYNIGLSAIYAGISSNSAYPERAWSFLEFLAEKSPMFCERLKAVPGVISDLIPGDYVRNDPFYSKAWDIFESSRIVPGFSGKPAAEEFESIFLEELRLFLAGGKTAQETVAAIQSRWNAVE